MASKTDLRSPTTCTRRRFAGGSSGGSPRGQAVNGPRKNPCSTWPGSQQLAGVLQHTSLPLDSCTAACQLSQLPAAAAARRRPAPREPLNGARQPRSPLNGARQPPRSHCSHGGHAPSCAGGARLLVSPSSRGRAAACTEPLAGPRTRARPGCPQAWRRLAVCRPQRHSAAADATVVPGRTRGRCRHYLPLRRRLRGAAGRRLRRLAGVGAASRGTGRHHHR